MSTIRIEYPPALMSRDMAAYYLSMSTRELDRLRQSSELIPVSSGTNVRFRKSELDAYIDRLPERVSKEQSHLAAMERDGETVGVSA